jgi:hypothetical protein
MTVYTQNPEIECEFYTPDGLHFTIKDAIVSYSSQKSLADPVSKAVIQLRGTSFVEDTRNKLKGDDYIDILGRYDLCKIKMNDGKGKKWIDIIGLVKAVSPSLFESDGVPEEGTSIEVVGLGEALQKYQIFWHSHLPGRGNIAGVGGLSKFKGKLPKGRPDEVLSQIFEAFINDEYVFTLADGRKIQQAVSRQFETITDGLEVTGLSALGMEGSLWDTLKRYSDSPWNEFFVDVQYEKEGRKTLSVSDTVDRYEDTVGLYLRSTPYNFNDWRDLAQDGSNWGFSYDDSERMGDGEKFTRDTDRIYNFFWVPAKSVYTGFDQLSTIYERSGGKLPIYDVDSMRQYGVRRLEQSTEYVEYNKDSDLVSGVIEPSDKLRMQTTAKSITDLLLRRSKKLHQWFGYDKFFDGSITTRGRIGTDSRYGGRIGGVLKRKRDNYQFYIVGIAQNWSFPGSHMTTFSVTRGHYPNAYLAWAKQNVGEVDQEGL